MQATLLVAIIAAFGPLASKASAQSEVDLDEDGFVTSGNHSARAGKALSVFQVIRFPNAVCIGSSSLNGTCYTASECTNKGGTSSGSCASGFGVCCTFVLGCGSRIAENCTYFQSSTSNTAAGQCGVTICKCSSDICQLRLDFNSFVITGPSTITNVLGKETGGSISGAGAVGAGNPFTGITQCLTDTFTITGVPGGNPPVICGTNTGYHVYADASDACNMLNFQLGSAGVGSTIPTRQWNIKITQISCYDANRAPDGCTQYFYGPTTGTLNSFNYVNSVELANQAQNICIRRERGYCKICYSTNILSDFMISNMTTMKGYIKNTKCCGYGMDGLDTKGYDCIIIPGALKTTGVPVPNQAFCGAGGLVYTTAVNAPKTVCSTQQPFQLQFLTDAYTQASAKYKGFKLVYWETTC